MRLRRLGSGTGKSSKAVLEEKKRKLIDQLRNEKNKKKRKCVSSPTKAQAQPESPSKKNKKDGKNESSNGSLVGLIIATKSRDLWQLVWLEVGS